MYKSSEPITSLHSVPREVCFRSPSEICPKFLKFLNFVWNLGIIFIEILLIFDNYHVLECFWEKNFEILGKFFVCKQTSDEYTLAMCFWTEWSDVIGSELLYIPHSLTVALR